MDMMGALESFVSAVRSGSLSGAARLRKLSQPAISQHITALEKQFETQLLVRGRGGVQMTPAGEVVFGHAVSILDEREQLTTALAAISEDPNDPITITADPAFSHTIMGEFEEDLRLARPDLTLVVRDEDQCADVMPGDIDIALRAGVVGDAKGIVRKIGTVSAVHVAAPKYLDSVGRPRTPDELIGLDYIQFKASDDQIATPLIRDKETIQAPIKIGLTAQAPFLVFQALNGGMGFTKMPLFLVADYIKNGQLEVVLSDWKIPEKDLFVVFPSGKKQSPQFITVLNVLMKRLGHVPGVELTLAADQLYPNA